MNGIVDDKSHFCIPFILERLEVHCQRYAGDENAPPFFLGLNGVQGAGKTVLVRSGDSQ
jgi:D-glycerate 3-kinase